MSLKFILFNSLGYSVYRTGEKQTKYKTPSALFMQKRKEKAKHMAYSPSKLKHRLAREKPHGSSPKFPRAPQYLSAGIHPCQQPKGGNNSFTISKTE
jgi:hypothetical protein